MNARVEINETTSITAKGATMSSAPRINIACSPNRAPSAMREAGVSAFSALVCGALETVIVLAPRYSVS